MTVAKSPKSVVLSLPDHTQLPPSSDVNLAERLRQMGVNPDRV